MDNASNIIKKMNIKERADGRYEGRITTDGIRKSFYGTTKAEVKNKVKEYLQRVEGGYKEPKRIRLNDYMEYWFKTYKLNKIEPSSYSRLYSTYLNLIKPSLGDKMIGNISSNDIQKLIDERANPKDENTRPLSLSGLKKITNLLNSCFKTSIKEGILSYNPVEDVLLPNESYIMTKTKIQFSFSDTEIKEFKKSALRKYKTTDEYCSRDGVILLLILSLGLRVGEMLALEWDDIDINNRIVNINKTVQSNIRNFESNKVYSKIKQSTKTKSGVRIIPINDNTIEYIQILKDYDERHQIKSKYVACTHVGTRNTPRNLQRSLDRLIAHSSLTCRPSLHTLRHTFGSTLLRHGVNIEVVSELMGHANTTITYNKYIHVIKEEKAKAMNMVNVF